MCKEKCKQKKNTDLPKYKKKSIPKALREQVWLRCAHQAFEIKCPTTWCQNRITAFDFHCGHMIAEVMGGSTTINNLIPICSRCNLSMGTRSFCEWSSNFVYSTIKPPILKDEIVGPAHYSLNKNTEIIPIKNAKRCCTIQ